MLANKQTTRTTTRIMLSKAENEDDDDTNNNFDRANLIINYLPQTMTDENFRVLFAKYGDIRSAKIVRNKTTGYSYGFGFVEYFNVQDAKRAINQLNGTIINSKKIKVSFARPSSDEIKKANIYVTNLPSSFKEEDVRNLFSECGSIIQCRLLGNNSGTAFVLFNLHEEAKQAIANFDDKIVPGTNCRMKVKFATNESNKKMAMNKELKEKSSLFPHYNSNNNINLVPKNQQNKRNRELIQPMMMDNNHFYYNNKSNKNYNPNSRAFSGPIRNTSHNNRYNPLSPAQQYNMSVTTDDSYSMMYSDGRNHQPYYQQPQIQDNRHYPYGASTQAYFNPNFSGTTSVGLSEPESSTSGMDGEHILFVYNIGPETDEFNLGKLFSYYGQVIRVNVIRRGDSGQGRGYGFVTMSSYQDAFNAINNLNGYKFINDQPLQVSFKRI